MLECKRTVGSGGTGLECAVQITLPASKRKACFILGAPITLRNHRLRATGHITRLVQDVPADVPPSTPASHPAHPIADEVPWSQTTSGTSGETAQMMGHTSSEGPALQGDNEVEDVFYDAHPCGTCSLCRSLCAQLQQ